MTFVFHAEHAMQCIRDSEHIPGRIEKERLHKYTTLGAVVSQNHKSRTNGSQKKTEIAFIGQLSRIMTCGSRVNWL